jgi:hypothetical protein
MPEQKKESPKPCTKRSFLELMRKSALRNPPNDPRFKKDAEALNKKLGINP